MRPKGFFRFLPETALCWSQADDFFIVEAGRTADPSPLFRIFCRNSELDWQSRVRRLVLTCEGSGFPSAVLGFGLCVLPRQRAPGPIRDPRIGSSITGIRRVSTVAAALCSSSTDP
jgi:hypothetical protein